MIRKNVLQWALLLSLCVFLAACSNNDSDDSSGEEESGDTQNTEETTEEETESTESETVEETEEDSSSEETATEEDGSQESEVVHITAEQSLEDVMNELISAYEDENEGQEIDVQYGHTETLTEDLINGDDQDMDIYFSSSDEGYDSLVEAGILDQLATKYLLINEIVLVTSEDNEDITSYDTIFNNEDVTLSIVNPEESLSGSHAKTLLDAENESNKKVNNVEESEDVDAAIESLSEGETDAALLLRTDISDEEGLRIVARAPRSLADPFVYGLGLSQSVEDNSAARDFYNFLQSEEALDIFSEYGYIV